jgi:hypothetical protein
MDEETEAPLDDLEAVDDEDGHETLGDGVKTYTCTVTLSPS